MTRRNVCAVASALERRSNSIPYAATGEWTMIRVVRSDPSSPSDADADVTDRRVEDVVRFPAMRHQPGSIGYVEKLVLGELLLIAQPRLIVETGTLHGYTTRFLAEAIQLNDLGPCRVVSFDLPHVVEAVRREEPFFDAHPEVELVGGDLPGSLARFLSALPPGEQIGLAVIDAEHTYGAVHAELELLHPYLTPGAYVFCHDYKEGVAEYEGLLYAVDRFARERGYGQLPLTPSTLRGDEVVWGAALLRKPTAARSRLRHVGHRLRAGAIRRLRAIQNGS